GLCAIGKLACHQPTADLEMIIPTREAHRLVEQAKGGRGLGQRVRIGRHQVNCHGNGETEISQRQDFQSQCRRKQREPSEALAWSGSGGAWCEERGWCGCRHHNLLWERCIASAS